MKEKKETKKFKKKYIVDKIIYFLFTTLIYRISIHNIR